MLGRKSWQRNVRRGAGLALGLLGMGVAVLWADTSVEKSASLIVPEGFRSNQRISDAPRRSFWAHTFSSGAHSVAAFGNQIYSAWYDVRNGDSDVIFTRSEDGGVTFQPNIRVNDDRGKAKQYKPSLGIDTNGGIYILWRDDRRGHADIYFARSGDGGKSFSKNLRVNDDRGWAYQGNPAIGVSPEGQVYAAWSDNRNDQDDIYLAVSRDKGRTFERNIKLNDDEGRTVQSHPTVAAGPDGLLVVAWEDFRNGHSEIYLARSTDGGKSFGSNRKLMPAGEGSVQVSPTLAAGSEGLLVLAWAQFKPHTITLDPPDAARGETLWWDHVREGDADIQISLSTDGGLSFGPSIRVNDDAPGNAQAFPSVTLDEYGTIYAAWEDFRNGSPDIFYVRVTHPGGQVGVYPNRKVNDDNGRARQYHPSLAVDRHGKPYILWTDGRGNPFVSSQGDDADAELEEEGNDVYFTAGRSE